MGDVKIRLLRVKEIYDQYNSLEYERQATSNEGKRRSILKQQVFLKGKLLDGFNKLQNEVSPQISEVTLEVMVNRAMVRRKVYLTGSEETIKEYITLKSNISGKYMAILDIKPMPMLRLSLNTTYIWQGKKRRTW